MADTLARRDRLNEQQAEIATGDSFTRLLPVVSQMDGDVARRTVSNFEPAVPVTREGIVLGFVGLLFGRLLAPLLGLSGRRRRRPA